MSPAHGVWVEGGVEVQGSPLDTNAVCELLSASGLGPPDTPARVCVGGGSHKGPQGVTARPVSQQPCLGHLRWREPALLRSRGPSTAQNGGNGSHTARRRGDTLQPCPEALINSRRSEVTSLFPDSYPRTVWDT